MKKQAIPIYLEERQHKILRRIAAEEKTSISSLIRRSVDCMLQALPAEKDPARQIIGLGSSSASDLATRHDEYFAKEVLRRKG